LVSDSSLIVKRFSGKALQEYIPDIARLRIEVFREFPYLYDGTLDYESTYLRTYIECEQAVVVLVFDKDRVVGASTGMPMSAESPAFQKPFIEKGMNPADYFYCAESVLTSVYRGQGLGMKFFEEREAHACELGGFSYSCFCAVIRPQDHPLRPPEYVPHDAFWRKRGYSPRADLHCSLSWKDTDHDTETSKDLGFWVKSLT
jgi:hypothetical protein